MTKKFDMKYYGNPVLNKASARINVITEEIRNLAAVMVEIMHKYDGIGLAAPQVGASLNLIAINLSSEYAQANSSFSSGEALLFPQMPIILVNPELSPLGNETLTTEEGCLSIPGIYAPVTRPARILLNALMLSGEAVSIECGGFLAKVLQHEVDHLKGILFVKRLDLDNYDVIKKKLKKLKKEIQLS